MATKEDTSHVVLEGEDKTRTEKASSRAIGDGTVNRHARFPEHRQVKPHIAVAPTEADFTNAIWKITLPHGLKLDDDPLLRIQYQGDVLRRG